jgi:hypothetical protein
MRASRSFFLPASTSSLRTDTRDHGSEYEELLDGNYFLSDPRQDLLLAYNDCPSTQKIQGTRRARL